MTRYRPIAGMVGRRLGGALTGLGVIVTLWSGNLWLGVPLVVAGIVLIVWAWKFD